MSEFIRILQGTTISEGDVRICAVFKYLRKGYYFLHYVSLILVQSANTEARESLLQNVEIMSRDIHSGKDGICRQLCFHLKKRRTFISRDKTRIPLVHR